MKKNVVKKLLAGALASAMILGSLAGCGGGTGDNAGGQKTQEEGNAPSEDNGGAAGDEQQAPEEGNTDAQAPAGEGGTIMWLSNLQSGPQYEDYVALGNMACEKLGYKFEVVYGDMMNDPAGNLSAVKNAMTDDVKALIVSQDGGIADIMAEYPELYVCGFATDLGSVYSPNPYADNSAVLESDKFLGCICDGFVHGEDTGKAYFDIVVEKGYKKVAQITFPDYAYPQLKVACDTFVSLVEEYNQTAADADKIEIVGETKVLEFAPLDASWFMEEGNSDLDCIVGVCAGQMFIYPAMKQAMGDGTCRQDTKLITSGFEKDDAMIADFGNDGTIQSLTFSPCENMIFPLVLIDNALTGNQYADLDTAIIDSAKYVIDSAEDMNNVLTKSFNGTADTSLMQISWEEVEQLLTRNNPDATYADLVAKLHSEQILVDALAE
ncbi:MAG: hypothetical protein HFI42_01225 [Lachnospiraceae bacterium]|nr:hypothetical protein [Lachnospiraceae bacterium]